MQSPTIVNAHDAWVYMLQPEPLRVTCTDPKLSQLITWANDLRQWLKLPAIQATTAGRWLHLGPLTAQHVAADRWMPDADALALRQLYFLHHLGVI